MSTPLFVPQDDSPTSTFGKLVSVETFEGLTANLNYLVDSMPIGSKVMILLGLAGVPTPDPTIWKICEGGVVTDQNSPLRGSTLPDDRGLYPKGATTVGEAGLTAPGQNLKSFAHNHGGNTQDFEISDDNSDTDEDYITVDKDHHHGIETDLSGPYNVEPPHIRAAWFIKVR